MGLSPTVRRRMDRLVGDQLGVVSELVRMPRRPSDPVGHWVRAIPASTEALFGRLALNEGSAASPSLARAAEKALGEAVERYCAAWAGPDRLRTATMGELRAEGERYLAPERFAGSLPADVGDQAPLGWLRAEGFPAGPPVWVPAAFVLVPHVRAEGEPRVVEHAISTGLAAHVTLERAVESAFAEVVERDAFVGRWLLGVSGPRLVPDSTDGLVGEALSALEALGARLELRLLSTDLPMHVVGAFLRDDRPPYTLVGCGSARDPTDALLSALEELLLGAFGLTRLAEGVSPDSFGPEYEHVRDLRDHAVAHAVRPELARVVDRFLAAEGSVRLSEIGPRSGWPDLPLYQVDLTTVDALDAGYRVARVLAPSLQPLPVDHGLPLRAPGRLDELRRWLGLPEGAEQRAPHPFP